MMVMHDLIRLVPYVQGRDDERVFDVELLTGLDWEVVADNLLISDARVVESLLSRWLTFALERHDVRNKVAT